VLCQHPPRTVPFSTCPSCITAEDFKMWKTQEESLSEALEVQKKPLATLFLVQGIAHSSA